MAFRHEIIEQDGYVSLRVYEGDSDEPVMYLDLHGDSYINFDAREGVVNTFQLMEHEGRRVIKASGRSTKVIGDMEFVSISKESEKSP